MELSAPLRAVLERLARHNHEVWAEQRLHEGWKPGPRRDDARREHPDLIPYDDLTEVERDYDRRTCAQTLLALLSLGWRIEPPSGGKGAGVAEPPGDAPPGPIPTPAALPRDLASLCELWEARPRNGAGDVAFHRALGEAILGVGEPLLAYDVVGEGLARCPGDLRLLQLRGLALARSGARERAADLLFTLVRDGHHDAETLGLLAGRQKELAAREPDPVRRAALQRRAFRTYERAYRQALADGRRDAATFAGINAATLAVLQGEESLATELAREVQRACAEALATRQGDVYWLEATLGEAALVLGEHAAAVDHYARAAEVGRGRFADLSSTRRQARALLAARGLDPAPIEASLRLPRVAVLAVPLAQGSAPPIPSAAEAAALADAMAQRLAALDAGFGYSAGTRAEEIVFLERIGALRGEIQLVLPFAPDASRGSGQLPEEWRARFERLAQTAAQVHVVNPTSDVESLRALEYSRLVLAGFAGLRAKRLDTELVAVALGDGDDRFLADFAARGGRVERIAARPRAGESLRVASPSASDAASADPPQQTRAMLFADAVEFRRVRESQMPSFVREFLGAIGELADRSPHAPIVRNTWGDGLFLVFEGASEAAHFALSLRERIAGTNWAERGLPASLDVRIALHAGPVYPCVDPVTRAASFAGDHIRRAARIEPITPPGEVYASDAFAALAEATDVRGVTFEYVGQTSFAKDFGVFPLYHVRRSASA